jgi:transcriptional regulator with XRE-family HTH domain
MGESTPRSWRAFGVLLAHFRTAQALTQAQLAERMTYSDESIASVEQGRRAATPAFVAAAEDALGTGGALKAMARLVAEELTVPAFFKGFAQIEAHAFSLNSYENALIPGLLQTEEYVRAVISARCPPLDDDEIERRVQGRLKRQEVLARKPPLVTRFIIDEAALRRPIGGRDVQKGQLLRLLECARLRNVQLQVLPMDLEENPGTDGPFLLVEGEDGRDLAYVEVQGVSFLISDPKEVSRFKARYGIIQTLALSPRESTGLIEKVAEEL